MIRYISSFSSSTTRQIRDLYNIRSGANPILQHSDDDKEFQSILLKALEVKLKNLQIKIFFILYIQAFSIPDDDDEDQPISYTVKLKDSDEGGTPTLKRRSIIKLPSELIYSVVSYKRVFNIF